MAYSIFLLLEWMYICKYVEKTYTNIKQWRSLCSACNVRAQSLSCVRLFATPWTVACQVPLSVGLPRQEYWNVLPFPSPGDLPDPGMELEAPALQVDSLPLSHLRSHSVYGEMYKNINSKTESCEIMNNYFLFDFICFLNHIWEAYLT